MKHDPAYQDYWKSLLDKFEESNMSVRAFCIENNVKTHQYYYWHDKLIKGKVRTQKKIQPTDSSFVKVNPIKPVSSGSIKIESGGVTLHVEDGFNHELLKTVLMAVKDLD